MGQIQSLEELISFLLRRKVLILLVAILGMVAAGIYAKSRPDTFQATAVIQVQGAQVIGGDPALSSGSAALMQSLEQQLTARDNLLLLVERHGLFADVPGMTPDQMVSVLRSSITLQSVASVGSQAFGSPANLAAIIITVRLGDAEQTARVANDFAQSIVDMSSSGATGRVRETFEFFQDQATTLESEMLALEAEIAAYKNEHTGNLPGFMEVRRTELVSLETSLRELQTDLVAIERERSTLAAEPSLRETERRRLEVLEEQIVVTGQQITALREQRGVIERELSATPEVERELSRYSREQTALQEQYGVVSRRLAEARTALQLADRQQTERFTFLERAVTPIYSVGADGKKLVMAGAVASLLLGIGIAFLLELLRPIIRTSRQLERQLGLRAVVTIPTLTLPTNHRNEGSTSLRRTVQSIPLFYLVAGGLTAVLLAASAFV
jgi:tyrosine-protein kinase Etk/Wzc